MDFNEYMEQGISQIASTLSNFYLSDDKGSEFLFSFAEQLQKSALIRKEHEARGRHMPTFLIASIAAQCNLHCAGCYARADGMCAENHAQAEMSAEDWKRVFTEASELGISFILLAGGEPLLRRNVINIAAEFKNILFPIFTNGTLIDEDYLDLIDLSRNLVPVFSIEGDKAQTDLRRGAGVSKSVENAMNKLSRRGILFAASITVTNENLKSVVSDNYLSQLHSNGCGAVFFVEYVPAEKGTENLVLSDEQSDWLNNMTAKLRADFTDMNIFSFPGDEKDMGGCLAAGRGFFHISPFGSAEACPFSPFSKMNLKDCSIIEILDSPFFAKIREISKRGTDNHSGGCTLFSYEDEVRKLCDD